MVHALIYSQPATTYLPTYLPTYLHGDFFDNFCFLVHVRIFAQEA